MASSPQYASDRPAVYTVGHSTRTIPEFVELLNKGPVELVVDIRSVPRSRTNPQFNLDALPEALAAWQIGHMQIPELGGLRRKSKIVPPGVNGFWINQSFHNYADYALSAEFHLGFSRLLEVSQTRRCAIMCSEAVWWRCHRSMIADALSVRDIEVVHILDAKHHVVHPMTSPARVVGGALTYVADLRE